MLKLLRKKAAAAALAVSCLAGAVVTVVGAGTAGAASVATWDKVAWCESTGDWQNANPPYYGGLQITESNWQSYGGTQYSSYPNQATKQQQILVAEQILKDQGAGAWPSCGPAAGLADDHADPYPSGSPTPPPPPARRPDQVARVHGDFNHDGHDDLAVLYGYSDGSVALYTFLGKADGGFQAPVKSWSVGPGQWYFDRVKLVAGDFNGDGRADLAAMYGYADGSVALFSFFSNPDGTFQAPVKSWSVGPGQWYFDHVQLAAGDFEGKGQDDLAAFYGYSDGSAALFTFASGRSGGFGAPVKSWSVGPNQWWGNSVKLTSGDYDGDGRTDLAAFYGYSDGSAALFTFKSTPGGGFAAPVKSWNVGPNQWWGDNVKIESGDFNGDGHADVAAMYGYADGSVSLFTFKSNADGTFQAPVKSWSVGPGQWYFDHLNLAAGDFEGKGRSDLAAFYGYSDGSAALFTFKSNTDGSFAAPMQSWNVGANQWWGDHVKLA